MPCGSPGLRDSRCVRTDFCHPTLFRLRAPAPRGFPNRVTKLSPRAGRGTERFTTPDSLRLFVRLCYVGGRCLPQTSPGYPPGPRAVPTGLWHLCRVPASYRWRLRTHRSSSGTPRLFLPRVREDHTMSTARDAFHRQVIASSGLTPSFTDPATLPPRFGSRCSFARHSLSTSFPVESRPTR